MQTIDIETVDDRRFMAFDPASDTQVVSSNAPPTDDRPKPKPSRHRHLFVEGSITEPVIEQVMKSIPKGASAAMAIEIILGRLGYRPEHLVRIRRRIARWEQNQKATHRMPTHLKVAATAVALVDAVLDRIANPLPEPTLKEKAGKFFKGVVEQFNEARG
jgi:hypothetical protein